MRRGVVVVVPIVLIVAAGTIFFLFYRSAFDEAVDCATQSVRWDYSDIHWSRDGSQIAVFALGLAPEGYIPITFILPADGDGDVIEIPGVDVEATAAEYDLALRPTRGWSPDRSLHAFGAVPGNGQQRQVFIKDADWENIRQLTQTRFDKGKPQWSPDGSLIAFASDRAGLNAGDADQAWGVSIVDVQGTDERLLTLVSDEPDIGWTPNSQYVLFSTQKGTYRINVQPVDGEYVTQFVVEGRYPVWSPDGTRMVYLSRAACEPEVFVVNADGSDPERIYRFEG